MKKWCFVRKTKLKFTKRYSLKNNGIAEFYYHSILEKANALQFKAELDAKYWDKAC